MDTTAQFVADLSRASIGGTTNPWSCHDAAYDRPGGAAIRYANLRRYLEPRDEPLILLVGEAPSYRGCRFSGIAFTSERSLPPSHWSSNLPHGWQEPSATIVHRVLCQFGIEDEVLLWNAVPTHPAADGPLTNRTPTRHELQVGLAWLDRIVALTRPRAIVAVGRSAESILPGTQGIRHPAHGGAALFATQLAAIVRSLGSGAG